jgi:hypothetical protein
MVEATPRVTVSASATALPYSVEFAEPIAGFPEDREFSLDTIDGLSEARSSAPMRAASPTRPSTG